MRFDCPKCGVARHVAERGDGTRIHLTGERPTADCCWRCGTPVWEGNRGREAGATMLPLWHVQPWYPVGDAWPDEPGLAVLVEAATREDAIALYEAHNPDGHPDHYRIASTRSELRGGEWNRAIAPRWRAQMKTYIIDATCHYAIRSAATGAIRTGTNHSTISVEALDESAAIHKATEEQRQWIGSDLWPVFEFTLIPGLVVEHPEHPAARLQKESK